MFSNNALLALGFAGILSPAEAFFRMSCPGRLVRERLDPIINPGGISTHVHTISGGSAFSAEMTFEQQRAAKCSSCTIKEDMSNYWTPQLYVKFKNGTFSPVPVVGDGSDTNGGMTVYYLQRTGQKDEKLKGFPEGFRMLAGDPAKRSFTGGLDAKAINFNCLGANKPETNDIPNYNCPGGLRAQVFFPSCWNGKDLDSEDHRSHMSYPAGNEFNTGSCPPEFPVHFISIFFEVLYDTNKYVDEWEGDQHPFVFANGDPTGYGFHGDFINGWDVDVLQKAVDTCTDDSGQVEKCGAVTQFTAAECNACKLPATVNEKVDGHLEKLPGCNPVSAGPERQAPSASCPAVEMGNPEPNFVDLTASKKWEYLGCGTDDKGARALSGDNDSADDMTVDKCIDFCSGAGFTYAGLEFGRECYCGNELAEANAPQDGIMGSCTMKCAGDDSQFCGNAGALSLYRKCDGECKNAQEGGSTGGGAAPAPAPSGGNTAKPQPSANTMAPAASSAATPAPSAPASSPQAAGASSKGADYGSGGYAQPSHTPTPTPAAPAKGPTSAAGAAAKPTAAPVCNRNNCVNQIFNPTASVSAKGFCPTWTEGAEIPEYLHNCRQDEVSNACACLAYYPSGLPKLRRRHAREM